MPSTRLLPAAACALAAACSTPPTTSSAEAPTATLTAPATPTATPTPTSRAPLAPLSSSPVPLALVDGDGVEFFVSLPNGATEPRPVVVGIHGAGDRPEWSCSEWRATTRARAFVVCPHGFAMGKDAYAWGSAEAIALRTARAVAALRARYGEHVAEGKMMYGGWSQGATLASRAVLASKGAFDVVAMVEIGHTTLDANAVSAELVRAGVKRAMIACSTLACRAFANQMEIASTHAKLPLRVYDAGLRGHYFDEPMSRTVADGLPWLLSDAATSCILQL